MVCSNIFSWYSCNFDNVTGTEPQILNGFSILPYVYQSSTARKINYDAYYAAGRRT